MTLIGVFAGNHPRLTLTLPGVQGPLAIDFTIDTGFDGAIKLPIRLARQLGLTPSGSATFILANGMQQQCLYYESVLAWGDEQKSVEVLVIEGNPLVGTLLFTDCVLHIEMSEGGMVEVELP